MRDHKKDKLLKVARVLWCCSSCVAFGSRFYTALPLMKCTFPFIAKFCSLSYRANVITVHTLPLYESDTRVPLPNAVHERSGVIPSK